MRVKTIISTVIGGIFFFNPVAANARNSSRWAEGADARKADYLYLEAERHEAIDQTDAYFELLRNAYNLNRGESLVGQELGLYYFMLANSDSVMSAEGYNLMEKHFLSDPGDYYNSMLFGNINDRLGRRDTSLEVWRKLHELFPDKTDATIRLADALASRSSDSIAQKEALDLLEAVRIAEGPSLPLTSRRVSILYNLSDTAATKAEAHRYISDAPANPEARIFAGDVYMAYGQPDSALTYYTKACEIAPESGMAYYKLAEYYMEAGDSARYDQEVFNALRLPDVDLDTKLEILTGYVRQLYTDTLQQPRINELFNTLIDLYPHEAQVHDLYSSYFVAVEDFSSAAEQQEYVIDADASDYNRWRGLISLYYSSGQYGKAADAAERAIEIFPDEPILYLSAGEASVQVGNYTRADSLYTTAAKKENLDILMRSQLLSAQGDLAYKQGSIEKAIEYYDSALVANPVNAMAMNNCAYFMACEGMNLEKADSLCRRSLELAPDNPSTLDTYAWIQYKMRNYAIAKDYIDRTLDLTDENSLSAELYEHAGDIYYANDLKSEALGFWKKALHLDPNNEVLQYKVKYKSPKHK